MEVKIKSKEGLLDATIEMIDGVMVVSPKKENVTKFKTGDIITCGWEEDGKSCSWVSILDGRIEEELDGNYFIKDFCSLYLDGRDDALIAENGDSNAATYVRYATEEEKEKLFKALAESGFEWDVEKRELVKLKWKPKDGDEFFMPCCLFGEETKTVFNATLFRYDSVMYKDIKEWGEYKRGWVFKTKQECQEICDKLNQAIEGVKP